MDAVAHLVRDLEQKLGTRSTVGIGTPGVISPATGLMKNANSTWLNGKPLDRDLAAALGRKSSGQRRQLLRPLRVHRRRGQGSRGRVRGHRGHRDRWGGGGRGQGIDRTPRGGGRVGAQPASLAPCRRAPRPACYCGKHGCIETFLSGPGLETDYRENTGKRLSSPEVAERAGNGDPEPRPPSIATWIAWPGPWPRSSTCSTRT